MRLHDNVQLVLLIMDCSDICFFIFLDKAEECDKAAGVGWSLLRVLF
jgi:hypothetical protein